MSFDLTLFYKEVADDLIEYIAYHEGEESVINFLLKVGHTPDHLINHLSFNEKRVESVVFDLVEKTVKESFLK